MDKLKDFETELNKCSKCGLCQAVCPIFKITQNDCTVSKGKFIMLHGVTKGDLKLSANINKYLDMCLKCGKCREFCPSDIDICKILNIAKFEYMQTIFAHKLINFFQSKKIFRTIIKIGTFLSTPFRTNKITSSENTKKIVYFKGCVNQIFPNTDKYLHKIFKESSIEIIDKDFDCCGLPFLSEGNLERFIEAAEHNTKLLDEKFDYLVTDCASCESTILDYPKYTQCKDLSAKLLNWGEIIANENIKFHYKKKLRVTFHKPCHLKNDDFFEQIIKNCENVEYVKMKDYDNCCGFAGSFALKNHKLSSQISKEKAKNIRNTNADFVITTCPACILGLKQGILLNKDKTKVVSLLEFLSKANKIYK
ncbi:MAG: (Fe-S)-binding protein [Cyanobacteria bacterium SIG26]|nr:(Fe-S)-binding protein [Cyanobacteria bacterium SIG26]